jgi:peptide/nickel transport system ATP-binding protein/glutathione transport system ATP-binding protein
MYLGRLVELGPRPAGFEDPRHPYAKTPMSAIPIADPRRRRIRSPDCEPGRIANFPLGRRPEPPAHDDATPGHFVLPRN